MTKEEKLEKQNSEKTKKYIDRVYNTVLELLNADEPQIHPLDKSYFIGWAIARHQPSDLDAIWALESIIDAFNNEQNEYDKLKTDGKSRLLDKINIFKDKLVDDPEVDHKKEVTVQ